MNANIKQALRDALDPTMAECAGTSPMTLFRVALTEIERLEADGQRLRQEIARLTDRMITAGLLS